MRAAELFSSASLASSSSHFLVTFSVRCVGHLQVQVLLHVQMKLFRFLPSQLELSGHHHLQVHPCLGRCKSILDTSFGPDARTYLNWPEVVGSCHKILAVDRDPFNVSLPFLLDTRRRHRIRWFQKGAEEG